METLALNTVLDGYQLNLVQSSHQEKNKYIFNANHLYLMQT